MIYRGYDIVADEGGYTWTDERGFVHYLVSATKTPYDTEDEAMSGIDAYKRNLAGLH